MSDAPVRYAVWLEIAERSELDIIYGWVDNDTTEPAYKYFVPGSARRRIEFVSKNDADRFRVFLRSNDIYVFDEGAI